MARGTAPLLLARRLCVFPGAMGVAIVTKMKRVHSTPPLNTSVLLDEKPAAEASATVADALQIPTDISAEELFEHLGRVRSEAEAASSSCPTFSIAPMPSMTSVNIKSMMTRSTATTIRRIRSARSLATNALGGW